MKSDFENYYEIVNENVEDLLNELYDDLITDLKEYSSGIGYFNWYNQNERTISEFNNNIYITLREAVDILEQSTRLCDDEGLYRNAGDCREQVQAMAYWTYRNDLNAEFKISLKEKLEGNLDNFEFVANELQNEIDSLEELIEEKEEKIEELREEIEMSIEEEKPKTVKALEKTIETIENEIEQAKFQLEKLEDEISQSHNLLSNVERFIGEL